MWRRGLAIAASSVLAIVLGGAAWGGHSDKGQPQPYALIYGTVFDPDGHSVYGVTVKIRREGEKKARWELPSNHTGEFAQRVPVGPGDYVVWADVKGYKLPDGRRFQPGTEVKVHVDGDERADIGLHLNWR
jgi:hypothetical protein